MNNTPTVLMDHYGRPIQSGDIITSVGWASGGGFPLWLTGSRLRVVKVNRKRLVVAGGPISAPNTVSVIPECVCIIERDGEAFKTDRDAWFAARSAEILNTP